MPTKPTPKPDSSEVRTEPVIRTNVDLSSLTTFGFAQRAAQLVEIDCEDELAAVVALARRQRWPILPLGGGSNLIFAGDYPGLIVRQCRQDIRYRPCPDDPSLTLVTASAGVNWHQLVMQTVERGLAGLENLSLIPGQVGAAPVQNIGAYGVELSDRFDSLRALHLPSGEWLTLGKADCAFAYRDSLFKRREDEYIITSVTLRLGSQMPLETGYQALTDYLETHYPDRTPDARLISEAVCAIRRARLPDPAVLPNAGSFFHNPVVSATQHATLKARFPGLVSYPQSDGRFKVAAGWLIDQLGLKGFRCDGVGVHERQALVLVKYHQTPATSLLQLADSVQQRVREIFGLSLTIEPRILPGRSTSSELSPTS